VEELPAHWAGQGHSNAGLDVAPKGLLPFGRCLKTIRYQTLQCEVVAVESLNVLHENFEVGRAVSIGIALHQHAMTLLLVTQLAGVVAKAVVANKMKFLISRAVLGIDAVQINLVAVMEVPNGVVA
jgi:hypothetical protein